jgi:ABC-type nitrate/sulfonate/bicarbonate transport system substrate-binding protein
VTVVDPFVSSAEHSKRARVLSDFCPFAPVPLLLTTTQTVLKRSSDDVQKFVRGWQDAVRVFQSDQGRAAEIYSKSLKSRGYELPAEVVAPA